MTPEEAAKLAAPFPDSAVGKLPRLTCPDCKGQCQQHKKSSCKVCKAYIGKHVHLDYVGHAHVRERLSEVDPAWQWEPLAFDSLGLPAFDGDRGLWIRLTVSGVTKLGYGHAGQKRGGDAVKEVIGDALRNAAMNFRVALDLWKKEAPGSQSEDVPSREVEKPLLSEEDERTVLRGQIFSVGRNKRMTASQIGEDYAEWTGGEGDIRTAKPGVLKLYLAYLQDPKAAA